MHHLSAIDELAEIRAEIARLKHREAALRKQIIASPPGGRTGRWHGVAVTDHLIRSFDPALLPQTIRDDPAYWREHVQTRIHIHAIQPRCARPGWPIRRGDGGAALH